jgi:hypothetical protein
MFENIVQRSIFGPKRKEDRGELIKLHNMYSKQNNITMIKSRRLR